jgi:prevent-host-death family protein
MQTVSATDAKNNFGELVDMARAAPFAITKHDRIDEYERLKRLDASNAQPDSEVDESDR